MSGITGPHTFQITQPLIVSLFGFGSNNPFPFFRHESANSPYQSPPLYTAKSCNEAKQILPMSFLKIFLDFSAFSISWSCQFCLLGPVCKSWRSTRSDPLLLEVAATNEITSPNHPKNTNQNTNTNINTNVSCVDIGCWICRFTARNLNRNVEILVLQRYRAQCSSSANLSWPLLFEVFR